MNPNYRFSFGSWNISDGADACGPAVRPAWTFEWKLEQLRKHGFESMMIQDDEVVSDINTKSDQQIHREVREFKRRLDAAGVSVDLLSVRLWSDPLTIDGAFTSNDPKARRYATDRALRAVEITRLLDCDLVGLCFVREGTHLRESKDGKRSVERIAQAIDRMVESDKRIRVCIEPKPNEPLDQTYSPTPGHALALAHLTRNPERVGVLIETSHCILAGLDPADEFDFALAAGKLWAVHLNDQNGLKYEQDKPFGSTSLRSAFNQVQVLERNGYGSRGESIAFEVYPFRTTKAEHALAHLINSRKTFLHLVEKARTFDENTAKELIKARDYQQLDQMVIEHLLAK